MTTITCECFLMCFALALGISSASAQGLSSAGACTLGSTSWTSTEEGCRNAGGIFFPVVVGSPTVTVSTSTMITNKPQPKCEEGWTLVADLSMQPMCARDLRKPK